MAAAARLAAASQPGPATCNRTVRSVRPARPGARLNPAMAGGLC